MSMNIWDSLTLAVPAALLDGARAVDAGVLRVGVDDGALRWGMGVTEGVYPLLGAGVMDDIRLRVEVAARVDVCRRLGPKIDCERDLGAGVAKTLALVSKVLTLAQRSTHSGFPLDSSWARRWGRWRRPHLCLDLYLPLRRCVGDKRP